MKFYYTKFKDIFVQSTISSLGKNPGEFMVESPTIPTKEELEKAYITFLNNRSIQKNNKRLADLRAKRDELLNQSDWTQFTDSPLSIELKVQWKEYRQQLRDLPESDKTSWPTPPPIK